MSEEDKSIATNAKRQTYGSVSEDKGEDGIFLKPLFTDKGYLSLCFSVPLLALQWHWPSILSALASAVVCWFLGYSEYSVVDPMIFKSIYVVFGFALGFRNVRANARYGEALYYSKMLFGTAWSVITLFREKETRLKVENVMITLLNGIAEHFNAVSQRADSWYALPGLRPTQSMSSYYDITDDDFLGHDCELPAEVEVQVAPRNLMVSAFIMIGSEICIAEKAPFQERKRTFWLLRTNFFEAYEQCELLTMPSVTKAFWTLITNVLFIFGVALPWGISASGGHQGAHDTNHSLVPWKELLSSRSLHSLAFIVFNTLMCMIVLFGLNALAHENEQPFKGGAIETIELDQLCDRFRVAVEGYERRRDKIERDVEAQISKEDALSNDYEGEAAHFDAEEHVRLCASS